MKNPRCWARALDDCVAQMDGDHILSAAAFGRESRDANLRVRVDIARGRATAEGAIDTSKPGGYTRSMTVRTLTANVLCKKHDNALSEVDAESGKLTKAVHGFRRLSDRRWIPGLNYNKTVFEIDGPRIERWFMKSLFTLTAQDGLRIGSMNAEVNTPPDELVRIVFGLCEPSGHFGLAGAAAIGRETVQTNEFSFQLWDYVPPADPSRRYIAGCATEFRGFKFVLNLDPQHPIPLVRIREQFGWGQIGLLTPLRNIHGANVNLTIRFNWPEHRYPQRQNEVMKDASSQSAPQSRDGGS